MKYWIKKFFLCISLCFFSLSSLAQINTQRLLSNGQAALHFEDYLLSIQYFNQLIQVKPKSAEAYFYRAIAKIQLGDYLGAELDCNKAIAYNPFLHTAIYARGYCRKQQGNFDDAIIDFSNALEFSPENAEYIVNRIESYRKKGAYNEALNDIANLLNQKSRFANNLWLEKTHIYLLKGDTVKASAVIDTALTIDKSCSEFYATKGLLEIFQNNDTSALSFYNKAVALKNQNPNTYINRALLFYRNYKYTDALYDYNRAIELDSLNTLARFNRSLLRSEIGDYNNAQNDLDWLLNNNPNYDDARYQRAMIFLQLHNYYAAKNDFSFLIERFPYFVPAYYGRAKASAALNQKRDADIDIYKAQKIEENYKNGTLFISKQPQIKKNAITIATANDQSNKFNTQNYNFIHHYQDTIRGQIQNIAVEILPFGPFFLSCYKPSTNLQRSKIYDPIVETFNKKVNASWSLTCHEIKFSPTLLKIHKKNIETITNDLYNSSSTEKILLRAINYSLIQDTENAILDLEFLLSKNADLPLANFCLAYTLQNAIAKNPSLKDKYISQIQKEYFRVLTLKPNFTFAHYNLGCLYQGLSKPNQAILEYSYTIEKDNSFAEAYFNRAICYLNLENFQDAIWDLSRAGELGIYQAYNIIKQITDKNEFQKENAR